MLKLAAVTWGVVAVALLTMGLTNKPPVSTFVHDLASVAFVVAVVLALIFTTAGMLGRSRYER